MDLGHVAQHQGVIARWNKLARGGAKRTHAAENQRCAIGIELPCEALPVGDALSHWSRERARDLLLASVQQVDDEVIGLAEHRKRAAFVGRRNNDDRRVNRDREERGSGVTIEFWRFWADEFGFAFDRDHRDCAAPMTSEDFVRGDVISRKVFHTASS